MTNKTFDTVEMTRRIRDKMYEETKGLNADELLRYFREHSESARKKLKVRAERQTTSVRA
jgi:hypothetical protein